MVYAVRVLFSKGDNMGYRQPSGTISLYSGVNLNPDYTDTLFVQTEQQALSQISSYLTATFEPESYTRYADGVVRVNSVADALATVNYMTFANRNANSGNNKTYFCFVTSIQYINERCTEIRFEIDDFMTWFPHLTLGECFVEREIVADDTIGKNIVPENLEIGELIEGAVCTHFDLGTTKIMIVASTLADGTRNIGQGIYGSDATTVTVNGFPSGLIYIVFDNTSDGRQSFLDTIESYNTQGRVENIIAIQLVPSVVLESFENSFPLKEWTELPKNTSFEGYTPKNNKLFTYPYTRLVISNLAGDTQEYKYEYFSGGIVSFKLVGCAYGNPAVMLMPTLYKEHIGYDKDYGLIISNFTQAPCFNDTFRAYLAQNKASITTSVLASAVMGIVSLVAAPASGGSSMGAYIAATTGISAGMGVASTMAKVSDARTNPTTVSGLTQADAINLVTGMVEYEAKNYCITGAMARVIDDYFSAFGYAVHRVKKPDISSRPTWNYVQTKGCIVKGACPAEARVAICRAFDRGIRFWKNHDYIGDYSQMN